MAFSAALALLASCGEGGDGLPTAELLPAPSFERAQDWRVEGPTPPASTSRPVAPPQTLGPTLTAPTPGLRLLGEAFDEEGHFTELVEADGVVRVANYATGVGSYRVHDDGDLEVVQVSTPGAFCTTVALHDGRVLCTAVDGDHDIAVLTIADDGSLAAAAPIVDGLNEIFDLEVVGDSLLIAAGVDGLQRMDLAAGPPHDRTSLLDAEVVRVVSSTSGHIAALDRDRGLLLLDGDASELASVDVVGPVLDLAFSGDRLAVAAGSEGVVVYDVVDAGLVERARLRPRCVASAVDVRGDLVAIGCMTGAYLYSLDAAEPTLLGFHQAANGVLDVLLLPSGLVVADWTRLAHYRIELEGENLYVDVPAVRRFSASAPLSWRADNPSSRDLTVDVELRGAAVRSGIVVPAGGTAEALIDGAELDTRDIGFLDTISRRARWAARAGNLSPRRMASRTVVVGQGISDEEPPGARPMMGEAFPDLLLRARDGRPATISPTRDARYVFYLTSCPLVWPQLEDLAWRATEPGAPEIIAVAIEDLEEGFIRRHRLEAYEHYSQGFGGLHAPDGSWPTYGEELYLQTFMVWQAPRGVATPTDYVVNEERTVDAMERIYRGAFPL